MQDLAAKYNIHLLTDYETSWYPSTAKSWQLVNDSNYVGSIRRVVIHDGHKGPKEIGCSKEFLEWLTDPVLNGGGAIIVTYQNSVCVIQASWNWPFSRKDMEIYGEKGYIITLNNEEMRLKNQEKKDEVHKRVTSKDIAVFEDPFAYFAGVIRGKITMTEYDPYSLKNNVLVVKILDAARESARTGKTVEFH